jgi:hypothetical protein
MRMHLVTAVQFLGIVSIDAKIATLSRCGSVPDKAAARRYPAAITVHSAFGVRDVRKR